LEKYYPSISKGFIAEAYVLEQASVKLVYQAGKLVPMIALPVSVALHAVMPATGSGAPASLPTNGGAAGGSAQPAVR